MWKETERIKKEKNTLQQIYVEEKKRNIYVEFQENRYRQSMSRSWHLRVCCCLCLKAVSSKLLVLHKRKYHWRHKPRLSPQSRRERCFEFLSNGRGGFRFSSHLHSIHVRSVCVCTGNLWCQTLFWTTTTITTTETRKRNTSIEWERQKNTATTQSKSIYHIFETILTSFRIGCFQHKYGNKISC